MTSGDSMTGRPQTNRPQVKRLLLRLHEIESTSHPVVSPSPTAEVLINKARDFNAGLIVMGAYGQPVLREFFLGTVPRSVLRASAVPVFCYH